MSREAYRRAERCFALARSTTFAGERSAAIARGTAIADKAGIDLDAFDIPGRVSNRMNAREVADFLFDGDGLRGDNFRYARPVPGYPTAEEIADLMERMRAACLQNSVLNAERKRRAFQIRVDNAVDFLRARGNVVRRVEGGYLVDGNGLMAQGVLAEARARGWRG